MSLGHFLLTLLIVWGAILPAVARAEQYLSPDDFVASSFPQMPTAKMLWLTPEHKTRLRAIFGHEFTGLRVRYWREGARTAWILDEIGKEQPITIGVTIADGKIEQVRILAFRESRGWEVRHGFFTDQFKGAHLTDSSQAPSDHSLDRNIDGITGATLSVRAVTRVARAALVLHHLVLTG